MYVPSWTAGKPGTSPRATTYSCARSSRSSAGATSRDGRASSPLSLSIPHLTRVLFICLFLTHSLFVVSNGSPLPPTGPPTLSLHALLTTARMSFGDETLDVDDIECMCASLIDQVTLSSPLSPSLFSCFVPFGVAADLAWECSGVPQGLRSPLEAALGVHEGATSRVPTDGFCKPRVIPM